MFTPARSILPVAVVLSCSIASLYAQSPAPGIKDGPQALPPVPPLPARLELNDGDTFVFLGDSITHQCLYTQYVENYFYTRYPQKRIRFHNAGVSGDIASNALDRFEEDVAAYRPKAVSILLGMNDGRYRPYDQAIFDTYQSGMTIILDKISALGAAPILMTPTMHDARAARLAGKAQEPRDTYYNGVLSLYGAWLREGAQQRGLNFVDMYSPLNHITLEQRRTAPEWTMIKDAIHPGPAGQFVMAAALIGDVFPKSQVGAVTLQQKDGLWTASASNGRVTELEATDGLAFTFHCNSLPWVVPADAAEGYKLTHAGHRMSNEKVTVRNLPPGKYEIRIDGQPIGHWTDGQLAFGVEIGENPATPQYQQALKVAGLNQRRNAEAYVRIRNEYGALKSRRNKIRALEGKPEAAAMAAEFEAWKVGMPDRVKALRDNAQAFEDEIYQVNQPTPHRYEVAAVKAP